MDELFASGFGILIHNHLENNREITTKTGLIRSLRNFYQNNEMAIKAAYQVHDTIPTSYIITAQVEDEEYRQLVNRFNEIQNGFGTKEKLPAKHCEKNMWLLKPAALNQGRGIEVCRTIKEINGILKTKLPNSVWLVQKYIERPLLFKGRKFDIRVWALATGKNDFFYYKHGYLRTSSSEYDPHATDNYIHLTNNCLQKFGENYGIHEKGNTLEFKAFQDYLDEFFPQHNLNFWTHILPRIKDLMIDSYLSGKRQMHKGKRNRVFELFGFDFLIDEDFRVWLLEVNTNPYLGIPNEYIEKLLPVMLDDLLALVVDPHIPPKNPRARTENDFELLYCEVASIYSPDGISKNYRQPYSVSVYPIEELAQIPLSKQKNDEEPHVLVEARPPPRDILQIVKEELETTLIRDLSDLSLICSRVIGQLKNWELMSEEQVSNALQALKLLCNSSGAATFAVYGHVAGIYEFCVSEEYPISVQMGAVEAIGLGCSDLKFRKEIVRLGICHTLINFAMMPSTDESLRNASLKTMLAISSNLGKKVYIPGETREYNWVRSKVIYDGMLLALFKLGQSENTEVSDKVKTILQNEFGLSDWEMMLNALDQKNENQTFRNHRANSFRVSSDSFVPGFSKEFEFKIPDVLNNEQFLSKAKEEIFNFCEGKREEIRIKLEKEKVKKLEDEENKQRLREIESKELEERRQKVEDYMKKRYEEIKKQKLEELKKQKESRVHDDKFDEMKKQLIIEKSKKTEEIKRMQRAKAKKIEENQRKIEEEKKREIEEKRKRVLDDWLRNKMEKEKEKKTQEKLKREEEMQRREIEYQVRKEEILQKIEEKRQKIRKPKEEKKERPRKSEGVIQEENSRAMLEQEDLARKVVIGNVIIPARMSPIPKELRQKRKKILEKKKKILSSVPNQFLFEVYASQLGRT